MVEALTKTMRGWPLLVVLLVFPSAVFAHQLDEFLQATLLAIGPKLYPRSWVYLATAQ